MLGGVEGEGSNPVQTPFLSDLGCLVMTCSEHFQHRPSWGNCVLRSKFAPHFGQPNPNFNAIRLLTKSKLITSKGTHKKRIARDKENDRSNRRGVTNVKAPHTKIPNTTHGRMVRMKNFPLRERNSLWVIG